MHDVYQDDGHIPTAVEKQIFETMLKIRKRDSSIYDSNKHFFTEADTGGQPNAAKAAKQTKPMLLKDVIAQQVT